MLVPSRSLFFVAALVLGTGSAQPFGQTAAVTDLSWILPFAAPAVSSAADADVREGQANRLNGDPRFKALLRFSLPHQQGFWVDHGRAAPLADVAQEFLGVPGSVLLSDNRYVTVDGCVPHDCGDRGMVWIDTAGLVRPVVIFTATQLVTSGPETRSSLIHLLVFSSVKLNFQNLPPQFRSSLDAWWTKTSARFAKWLSEQVVLVTIFQPSGQTMDISPALLGLSDRSPDLPVK